MSVQFPTSKDVHFELNGKKVAIVQSYNTSYQRDNKEVDAFGEVDPVGFAPGKRKYSIKITKAYIDDAALADGINFYNLDIFDFVIVKPDRRIVYTGCHIVSVDESGSLNDVIAENISISALTRREDPTS